MPDPLAARLRTILNSEITDTQRLTGGCVADVRRVTLADGTHVVIKLGANLDIEGAMLRTLADRSELPVPDVLHSAPELLVMSWVEHDGRSGPTLETHAADLLADLHAPERAQAFGRFGHDTDTLIGGLHQPNPPTASWIPFFRDQRLRFMARCALDAGRLDADTMTRVDALAERLPDLIDEPAHPSLIHGDVWSGNVLADNGRVAAFIDPAVYHAHHEMELAFITLFSTFGGSFFDRYREQRPIDPGFETRRSIYNLYPLLVHVRLFGGGYVGQVRSTLSAFGC